MTEATKQYFKGYNVRELLPVTTLSRKEYLKKCNDIIEETINIAIAGLKDPKEIKKAKKDATMKAYRMLALNSTFFLYVFVLGNSWCNTDYAYRLGLDIDANKWKRPDLNENGHTLWVLAREHLKSLFITCASTLRELLNDPNRTYCIFSYNEDIAKGFMGLIKQWCEDCELLKELFPDILWSNPAKQSEENEKTGVITKWTWTTTAIEFKRTELRKEKTIEVSGLGGGAKTGYHFSHLIYDDAETASMVVNPEFVTQLTENISNSFNVGQTQNLNACFIGTFYAREDLYCRLIKKRIIARTVLQPCYDENNETVYYTKEALQEKHKAMTPSVWATQMLCDPSMSSNSSFNPEWLARWDVNNLHNLNIYTFVDPAGTKNNKSDYTAIWTVGFDCFGTMLLIDIVRDKLTLEEKFKALCEIKRKYNPLLFYYERVGMQADIDAMNMMMSNLNIFFNIIEYNPSGSKAQRIEKLILEFTNGNVRLPHHCWHTNWEGLQEDMLQTFIQDEFLAYPTGRHDDALDSLSMAASLKQGNKLQMPSNAISETDKNHKVDFVIEYDPFKMINGL